MKSFDRLLQQWRIRQATPFVPAGGRVIDVGAFHGELFAALGPRLVRGFGIEPLLPAAERGARFEILPGLFPAVRPNEGQWDAITLLAVLEHIPLAEQPCLADACFALLRPGGRVIVTVPAPAVDRVLAVLRACRLIDGMSLEEHFGFQPRQTEQTFATPRFRKLRHARFQLGLNHLFVFERMP